MAFSFKRFFYGINLVPKASSNGAATGDTEVLSTNGKMTYFNAVSLQSGTSPIVTEVHASQGTNRLQNKDLDDATTAIVNTSDTTKKIVFSAGSSSASVTTTIAATSTANRTLTLPDATDTLAGIAATQTLTNKSISGSTNTFSNIPNGATTATSANTPSTIVARDGSGNFSAGTITATLSGNATNITASSNSTLTTLSALSLPGTQVTGTVPAATIAGNVSGVVAIANGGTGQTTASTGFNALSPMTTGGDLIYGGASGSGTRLANGTSGQVLTSGGGTSAPSWTTVGTGTVTSVSVVSANGLAGTVATATTTPAITLSTSITGLLKGNGTAISAATSGTDYAPAVNYQSSSATTTVSSANDSLWIAHNTSVTTPNVVGSLWKISGSIYYNGQSTAVAFNSIQAQWSSADGAGTSQGSPPAAISPTFGTVFFRYDFALASAAFNWFANMPEIIVGPNVTVYLTPNPSWGGVFSVIDNTSMIAVRIQ